MTFLNPVFFWAFLSLIPLAAIYLLKVRPRRKPTTAYFLWEKIFQEKRTSSLFRRLRDFWSLLLMALVFSAVALALTNPQWTGDERKDALILIDHSASMSADDGGATRLDRAKKTAADIVRAFNGAQRAAVATVAHDLTYRSHLTDNPRQLLDAIESIGPADHAFRPDVLAASQTRTDWSREHRTILISDGCFDRQQLPPHIELLKVGAPRENIGIIAADAQYLPGTTRRLAVYVQVASSHPGPVPAELLISRLDDGGGEQLFRLIPLDVKPGVNKPQVYELDGAEPGRWTAKLDIHDALATDDTAYLAVEKPRPVRVAVESDDRFFFENSVIAFSRGAGLLTLTDKQPQIVLAKSSTPDAPRSIIFQPAGESPFWSQLGDPLGTIAPRLMVEDHPALRYLDAISIPYIGARRLEVPPGAQVWVASDDGVPLIYRTTQQGKTAMVVNMDPLAAEFYFSAWFPVLVHSAATFLAGRERALQATYAPHGVVTIPGVQDDGETNVTQPDGNSKEVVGKTLRPRQLGFYELKNDDGDWLAACSLLAADETMIDNGEVKDTSQPIARGWAPAQLLTMLAILVLTAESLLYYRRKVG